MNEAASQTCALWDLLPNYESAAEAIPGAIRTVEFDGVSRFCQGECRETAEMQERDLSGGGRSWRSSWTGRRLPTP